MEKLAHLNPSILSQANKKFFKAVKLRVVGGIYAVDEG